MSGGPPDRAGRLSDSGRENALLSTISNLEATLDAIRRGGVDALVVSGPRGDSLYSLSSADRPYRVIVEEMGDGAATLSESGIVLYANQRFADLLNAERTSLLGLDLTTLVQVPHANNNGDLLATPPGTTSHQELTLIRSDGGGTPVLASITGLDLDGTLIRCLIVADLTRRVEAEEQLGLTFKYAPIGLALESPEGRFDLVNPALCQMLGRDAEALQSMTWMDLTLPEDIEASTNRIKDLLAGRVATFTARKRYLKPDGSILWGELSASCLRDEDGSVRNIIAQIVDVSEQVRTTKELEQAAQYARSLFEAALDPMMTIDSAGTITDVNQAAVAAVGVAREQLNGTPFSDYFSDPEGAREVYRAVFEAGSVTDFPLTMRHRDEHEAPMEVLCNGSVYRGVHGEALGALVTARDVTEQIKSAEVARSLLEAEDLVTTVMTSASVGIALIDSAGSFRVVNGALCALLGYDEAWFLSHRLSDTIHSADRHEVVHEIASRYAGSGSAAPAILRLVRADDKTLWARLVTVLLHETGDDPSLLMVQVEDVTAEHEAQEALAFQAIHDPLTGLHNRTWILDIVQTDLVASRRAGTTLGVLFVDLDHFKVVNDSLGHDAGDEVLTSAAKRIVGALRAGDRVGRFGGDEFVIVVQEVRDASEVERCAERVSAALAVEQHVRGHRLVNTASIGIALSSAVATPESLLRDSDAAMYRAKVAGRARWQFFDDGMHAQALARLVVEDQLRDGITRDEFVTYYQPIVALADSHVVGHEALVRWAHPTRGILPPADFIDVAEDSGLITFIGAQVLDQVCALIKERPNLLGTVSVNVSAVQLAAPGWLRSVTDTITAHHVNPARLVLEITETAALSITEDALRALKSLRELGVGIHLDDFGTGYSSISVLRDLPVTGVKLDLSFVQALTSGESQANALAQGLSGLVRGMHLTGITEGVETKKQAHIVRAQGWECGQGYYFGRPAAKPIIGELIP